MDLPPQSSYANSKILFLLLKVNIFGGLHIPVSVLTSDQSHTFIGSRSLPRHICLLIISVSYCHGLMDKLLVCIHFKGKKDHVKTIYTSTKDNAKTEVAL